MSSFWIRRAMQWGISLGLVLLLFSIALYRTVIIPTREKLKADRLELARDLTNVSLGVLRHYRTKEQRGEITRAEAQEQAKDQLRATRYGPRRQGYFFCVDRDLRSVLHPLRRELEGRDMSQIADPSGRAYIRELVAIAERDGEGHLEYIWYSPDGGRRVPKLSYVAHYEPWGWVIGTGILVDDIEANIGVVVRNMIAYCAIILAAIVIFSTLVVWKETHTESLRLRAEHSLRKSEEDLSKTLHAIADAVITTDIRGNVTRMNPVAEKLTGWRLADAEGNQLDAILALTGCETRGPLPSPTREILQTGKATNESKAILQSRSGQVYHIASNAALIEDKHGRITGIVLVFRDVTDEFLLAEERSRLSTILESTNDFVSTALPDSTITYMNKAGRDILGWESDLSGKKIRDVHPESVLEMLRETAIPEAMKNGIWSGESRIRALDDSEIPVSQVIMAHKSPSGEIQYLSTIMRDLRDRVRAEEARRQLEEELLQKQKMDSLGQLSGGIAHDFNNMLGGVLGAAELLTNTKPGEPRERRYIDLIINTVMRASDLTQKLLTFSRKASLVSTTVDLHEIIEDTVVLLERSIDKRITVVTALSANAHIVVGDPSQLQNAILNLGLNARDALEDGGNIEIRTQNQILEVEFCRQQPFELEPGPFIRVDIKDTGHGMPEEISKRVFEPFFTTKEAGHGTGLGLAAVYGTVKEHRGAVTVQSECEVGTTFSLYLPAANEANKQPAEVPHESISGTGCILLADDEDAMRVTTRHHLEDLGYEVIVAEDGEQAVAAFAEHRARICLTVLDMVMPRLNGQEAFYKIRAIDPEAKVIIASGFTGESVMAQLCNDGLCGFIQKPFRASALDDALKEALARRT